MILHFHGGAYTQPATSGTFLYLQHIISTLETQQRNSRKTIAGLVLAYDLAPEHAYPTQLQQAVAVLAHLLSATGREASSVFLSGDSAGAHLALGLLSHVLHPHPEVERVEVRGRLRGVVLYSPVVSWRDDWESVGRNKDVDMLPVERIRWWGAVLHGKGDGEGFGAGDAYTEALLNGVEWWEGMHGVVGSVLVTCGGGEVFVDSAEAFCGCFKKGWVAGGGSENGVVVVKTMGETHIGPIVDFMMKGGKVDGCASQRAVEDWYLERLER